MILTTLDVVVAVILPSRWQTFSQYVRARKLRDGSVSLPCLEAEGRNA